MVNDTPARYPAGEVSVIRFQFFYIAFTVRILVLADDDGLSVLSQVKDHLILACLFKQKSFFRLIVKDIVRIEYLINYVTNNVKTIRYRDVMIHKTDE